MRDDKHIYSKNIVTNCKKNSYYVLIRKFGGANIWNHKLQFVVVKEIKNVAVY